MTNERAKMLYYEQRYENLQEERMEEAAEYEARIWHLKSWIGVSVGTNIATAGMLIWIIWAVL